MPSKVMFIRTKFSDSPQTLAKKTIKLFEKARLGLKIRKDELVAIKQHFGEGKGTGYIKPPVAKALAEMIKSQGGKPFLNETATLYKGRRSNAVDHLNQAYEHGFTPEGVGCPIVIADGLVGASQVAVRVNKKHYEEVYVAGDVPHTDAMIVLTHVTGHIAMGFGGAIKNIGMGLSSRAGKLNQHHGAMPLINKKKCTACGSCERWCPADAITVKKIAVINPSVCIGCGECFTVCPADAIGFTWQETSMNLQEKVVEHALGISMELKGRVAYINFATDVTKGCDCFDMVQKPMIRDAGILASTDPVALDLATFELLNSENNGNIFKDCAPGSDATIQMKYGEKVGLGSTKYELIEVK